MKTINVLLSLLFVLSISQHLQAQKHQNEKVKEEVNVEFENNNGAKKLTVTTKKNGKVSKEVYSGEEAEKKMEELNNSSNGKKIITKERIKNDSKSPNESTSISATNGKVIIKTITDGGKEEIEEIDLVEGLKNLSINLNDLEIDSSNFELDLGEFEKKIQELSQELEIRVNTAIEKERSALNSQKQIKHPNQVVITQEETLTPDEIQQKYGVDVNKIKGRDTKIIIKKIIRVK